VNIFAIGEERLITRKGPAHAKSDLGESGIGINEHAPPAQLKLVNPVHVAQVEIKIRFRADIDEFSTRHAVRLVIFRQKTPVAGKPDALEHLSEVSKPVFRI
jgi:hypothetical protein